ncbi:Os08g0227750 [Oryza sativa Japonica Group]|uniref:Os08g0227750 protein n=1 Tax=Oryza sativa subsp. japonica TaxID=39947 RepID=A0A0P0XD86_ORYSJ|nr:Os08g0227750 [Oryza sativa Japonica Group]
MGIDLGRSTEKRKQGKGSSGNLYRGCGRFSKKNTPPTSCPSDQDRRVYNSRVHECRRLGVCIGYVAQLKRGKLERAQVIFHCMCSSMHTEMAAMAERLHLRHRLRLHHQQVLQLLR